jgi:hypothetical protein
VDKAGGKCVGSILSLRLSIYLIGVLIELRNSPVPFT